MDPVYLDILPIIFGYLEDVDILKSLILCKDLRKHFIKNFRDYFGHVIFYPLDASVINFREHFKKACLLLKFKRMDLINIYHDQEIPFEAFIYLEYLNIGDNSLRNSNDWKYLINLKVLNISPWDVSCNWAMGQISKLDGHIKELHFKPRDYPGYFSDDLSKVKKYFKKTKIVDLSKRKI